MDQKGLKYMKKGFWDQKNPVFMQISEHLENLDSFEIIRKIGSHLEKFGQF